jgi:hypothetical protein
MKKILLIIVLLLVLLSCTVGTNPYGVTKYSGAKLNVTNNTGSTLYLEIYRGEKFMYLATIETTKEVNLLWDYHSTFYPEGRQETFIIIADNYQNQFTVSDDDYVSVTIN